MTAGQQVQVSVTMRNTGTNTWTAALGYNLGAQPWDNWSWGATRVGLGADSIATNQQKTFTFTVTAPSTPGTYNFQWQMLREGVAWFGNPTPSVLVTVQAAAGDAAQFVAQSVPSSMTAGQQVQVSVTMKNTGTNTWTAAQGDKLGAQPWNNWSWGLTRVNLGGSESVATSQQRTFTFTVTAPSTPGTYNFQWRMLRENVAWFGDLSPAVAVTVEAAGTASQYVSQSVPSTMTAGQLYQVSVTMENMGATWTAAEGYKLGAQPWYSWDWGLNRVLLSPNDSIADGQQKTFAFTVRAPTTPGTYDFQWRMLREGVEWFGDLSPAVPVAVQ
jgi:hypothetical protein